MGQYRQTEAHHDNHAPGRNVRERVHFDRVQPRPPMLGGLGGVSAELRAHGAGRAVQCACVERSGKQSARSHSPSRVVRAWRSIKFARSAPLFNTNYSAQKKLTLDTPRGMCYNKAYLIAQNSSFSAVALRNAPQGAF